MSTPLQQNRTCFRYLTQVTWHVIVCRIFVWSCRLNNNKEGCGWIRFYHVASKQPWDSYIFTCATAIVVPVYLIPLPLLTVFVCSAPGPIYLAGALHNKRNIHSSVPTTIFSPGLLTNYTLPSVCVCVCVTETKYLSISSKYILLRMYYIFYHQFQMRTLFT